MAEVRAVTRASGRPYLQVKRGVDLAASLLLLAMLSPVLVFLSTILFISNRANPFFLQERIGRDEQKFRVVKLKTMREVRKEGDTVLADAARLTSLGRIIRKSSLDELPQLINIVRGEMSFIGPRPLLTRYLPFYTDAERARHSVRPGISGLAQVNGRNELEWSARLAYDIEYVERLSARLDAQILLKTVASVFRSSGVRVDVHTGEIKDLDVERRG